jgi:type IV secretory pathway VirB6-like protein
MIGYQFFMREFSNKIFRFILFAVILLSHHQIAFGISATPGCNKSIDQNCDNSCITSQNIFNVIDNYVDQTPVFDANYTLYDQNFNMIAAEGSQRGTNPIDGTLIDGCVNGNSNVMFYYSSPKVTTTPATNSGSVTPYSYGNVRGTITVTNTPTLITSVNAQTINTPKITGTTTITNADGSTTTTTTSSMTDSANIVKTTTITTNSSIPPPNPVIITENNIQTNTITFADGSTSVTTTSNGITSSPINTPANTTYNNNPATTQTIANPIGSGTIITISQITTYSNNQPIPVPTTSDVNGVSTSIVTYDDGSSTSTSTTTTTNPAPFPTTTYNQATGSRTITYYDGSTTTYSTGSTSPTLHTLSPGQTTQVTTNNANDTNLRAISTLDYICVEVETLYGWVPLGCAAKTSQSAYIPSCFSLPQSGFPITSTVVACVSDAINSTFVTGSDNISSLSNFQINMQSAVMGFLVIYIIIFGMKLVLGQEIPNKGELFMFIIKMTLVIYFSVGLPAGSSATANGDLTQSTNGVQDIIMPGFQALSLTLSQVIVGAENSNNGNSSNSVDTATQKLAATAREANAIKQSANQKCATATSAYKQSSSELSNTIVQLAILSEFGYLILNQCYIGGGIISYEAPLCVLASAVVISGIMGASSLEQNYQPINSTNLSAKNIACAESDVADAIAAAADAALANTYKSSNSSLCYFDPSSYVTSTNYNYEYLSTWDNLDCHVAYYLGFLSAGGIGRDVSLAIAIFFTGFFLLIFSGQLVFAVFSITIGILLLSIIVFFVNTYLVSLIASAILAFLAPLFVPLCLLKVTKGYFDLWLKLLFSFALQPVIITAYIVLMCTVLDQIIYGTCTWSATASGFWTIATTTDTKCLTSLGAQMNFAGSPSQGAIDFFVTSTPFYIFQSSIMVPLFMATLFCFLFYFMAQNVTEFAMDLVGGPNLNDFTGIKSNSLFNSSMSKIKKILPQTGQSKKNSGSGNIAKDGEDISVTSRSADSGNKTEASVATIEQTK